MNKRIIGTLFVSALLCLAIGCGGSGGGTSDASIDDTGVQPDGGPHIIFSTYIGGSTACNGCSEAFTFVLNNATDSSGNTYVTGLTQVKDLPFNAQGAFQPQPAANSSSSAFLIKFGPSGNILWGTYLGGDNQSIGIGVAVMPGGGVAVAGLTTSDSSGAFPLKNAYQGSYAGNGDYFVSVFDAGGNLLYSTYLGGSETEGEAGVQFADDSSNGNNVAVDSGGLVYVTGITASGNSSAAPFPLSAGAVQHQFGGAIDAFVSVIDPTKSGAASLLYSSFIGGTKQEKGHSVTASQSGAAITVVGYTKSTDFPTTGNAFRNTPAPPNFTSNGFVAQFSSSSPGSPSSAYANAYSTYLGADSSAARDDCYGVTTDKNGYVVVTGRTESSLFPMLDSSHPSIYNNASYLSPTGSNDEPYLTKLDTALSGAASLVYSTFLGGGSTSGGGGAFASAVAVDQTGNTYVIGETMIQGAPYVYSPTPQTAPQATPYTADAYMTSFQGIADVLVMEVSADGTRLNYSTFLGGPLSDRGYGASVDPSGNFVISGLTYSTNFPTVNAAQQYPGNTGHMNGFLTKMGR